MTTRFSKHDFQTVVYILSLFKRLKKDHGCNVYLNRNFHDYLAPVIMKAQKYEHI